MFRRLFLVVTMLLLASPSSWSQVVAIPFGDTVAPQPKSRARATFHIAVDGDYGDKHALVAGLLSSKPLQRDAVQAAIRSLLKEQPTDLPEVTFTPPTANGSVQVQSFDELLPAEKVLEAFKEVLAAKLFAMDTTRMSLEKQIAQEQPRVAELAASLADQRAALTKLAATSQIDVDPIIAAQKRSRLESETQSLEIELRGLEVRRDLIELQIAKLGRKANDAAKSEKENPSDPILAELMKSIEARQVVLKSRQTQWSHAAKGSSLESVAQAQDELAKAELELAKYRRTLVDAIGGQRVADLQRRLEDTAIDYAEIHAKLRAFQQLADFSRKHSAEVEAKRIEVELLEQDYRRAREELGQLESKLRQHVSPTVTFIPLS